MMDVLSDIDARSYQENKLPPGEQAKSNDFESQNISESVFIK